MPSTHASRIDRWLGAEAAEHLSKSMRGWYGRPIAIGGIPGNVWIGKDGDFMGRIHAGEFVNAVDFGVMRGQRILRNAARRNRGVLHTGFSSLSDLIAEATGGKRREFTFNKVGPTGVANVTSSLWRLGPQPAVGTTPSAAPGGNAPDDSTTGGFLFTNPSSPDTQHLVSAFPLGTVAGNTLLLYDRIFHVAKTMASTGTEAVTGVPTRYQSATGGAADFAGNNFLFVEIGGTALAATGHNWTVCTYTDESGNTGATLPSLTGNNAGIVDRLDHPTNQWFAPLATGDVGIKALTQMQCSASVATGLINFVIGHPIMWMPIPLAGIVCIADGINTAFNLTRVFDDACLAFLEVIKPSTTATTYTGTFTTVAG